MKKGDKKQKAAACLFSEASGLPSPTAGCTTTWVMYSFSIPGRYSEVNKKLSDAPPKGLFILKNKYKTSRSGADLARWPLPALTNSSRRRQGPNGDKVSAHTNKITSELLLSEREKGRHETDTETTFQLLSAAVTQSASRARND